MAFIFIKRIGFDHNGEILIVSSDSAFLEFQVLSFTSKLEILISFLILTD